ncbi:MAG: ATP synthase F1 subunit epsilon [Candidatus Pelagibacter sp.]|nr:ATP synthase F1 subunit epsilon [Candidatus Pelagibacter sp.]OUW24301.1 MAG: ATP synthase F1 subunit epsilon [Rickettsiales bacterium TMED174]|tara:strand:+ start:107 stop:496 length:390 start_codon:yes stop_codon:yes gene_type:complete
MSKKFKLEIISPEKLIYKSEPNEVVIPSYEGYMTILPGHIPLITFLRPGIIEVTTDQKINFYIEEGTVEFKENKMLILSNTAKDLKVLTKSEIDKMKTINQDLLNGTKLNDKERFILSHKEEILKSISQ